MDGRFKIEGINAQATWTVITQIKHVSSKNAAADNSQLYFHITLYSNCFCYVTLSVTFTLTEIP